MSATAQQGSAAALNRRYLAYIRAVDRPGSLTAVAEVVSNRGVSVESLATADFHAGTALMTVAFRTSARLARLIERTLGRLAVVVEVLVLAEDDPRVLAAGVVQTSDGLVVVPAPTAEVTWSGDTGSGQPLLLQGPLRAVEKVLADAVAKGADRTSIVLLPPAASEPSRR